MNKIKKDECIYKFILGLLILISVLWVVVTNLVYTFINHGQPQAELTSNFWNAITCQWHRSISNEGEQNDR